jgi:tol-pal system beta propeller repeat protein TolB
MRAFSSETAARNLVLGFFALIGTCLILAVVGITARAVIYAPKSAGTPEPWVATGLAEMATYSVEQTRAAQQGGPTPIAEGATPAPQPASGEPSGKIVYTCFVNSNDDLCIMNADGSNVERLTAVDGTDWYAALSPDGQLISFSSRRSGSFEAYIMDIAGQETQLLTQSLGDVYAPEVSPDGTRVVMVTTVNGKQDIYVLALDGSGITRITTDPNHDIDPTWSPDGTRILFTSNRTGTNEIYVINADGSGERQVTNGSGQREGGRTDWSPDGQWIAFYAGQQGDKDLFMIPASCTESGPCGPAQITRLTDGGNNKAPAFSPDSLWITFASMLGGGDDNDIWIMRLDTRELRQVTDQPYAEWQPRWGP